jgi:hypothetical protein
MQTSRFLFVACLTLAILLPTASASFGQGAFVLLNGRNHPELQWKELRTEHFRVFYHDPLEPWAREASSILERFHAPLCRQLDVAPDRPTRVYLSDQDQIANGAAVGADYCFVWIPSYPALRSFSGSRPWFEEVLIHEYTHILVARASQTWLGNAAYLIGAAPPRWLQEGIAQWTAETWNVYRGDGTLSAAVLDGSIDRTPPGIPGDGALLYARGNARVRWLASAYGDSVVRALIRPVGGFGQYSYGAAEARALAGKAESIWERFRRSMTAFYGERYRRGESPDSIGTPVDGGLRFPSRIVSRARNEWSTGQEKRGPRESSLFLRMGKEKRRRILAGAVTGTPVPLPQGCVIVPRYHRAAHGSWVQDLAFWDPSEGSRFVTHGARIGEAEMVAGDRIVAIGDTPKGPAIYQGTISPVDRMFHPESVRRWPYGWGLHSLAASPDGMRIVLSGVHPDGRRGLWGSGTGSGPRPWGADTLRLSWGRTDERSSVWIDNDRLAWVSHRSGLAEVYSARWPLGSALEEIALRTGVGCGVDLAGRQGDSLLVLDRSSRLRTPILRLQPGRMPARAVEHDPYPFPKAAAVEPEDREISIDGPFSYRALGEVRPWLRLPLFGPQAAQPALGALGFWADPLLRHAWGGMLYANADQTGHPDVSLFYLTTRWGPYAGLYHSSQNLPRRILNDRVLWERKEVSGAGLLAPLQRSADPNFDGWLDLYAQAESHRPRYDGRSMQAPRGRPRAWSSFVIGGEFGYTSVPPHAVGATAIHEGSGMNLRLRAGLDPLPESSRFFRGSLRLFHARAVSWPFASSVWTEVGYRGLSPDLPPQEFEGIDADPSHEWIAGWPGLEGTTFVRGWNGARAATHVLHADVEARLPILPDLGLRGPGVALGAGTLAPFLEGAHPWGGTSGSFRDERTRVTFGLEARLAARLGPLRLVPAIAWGRPFGKASPNGDWSWRITTGLPVSTPFAPPQALRALLCGALHQDSWGAASP